MYNNLIFQFFVCKLIVQHKNYIFLLIFTQLLQRLLIFLI